VHRAVMKVIAMDYSLQIIAPSTWLSL